MTDAGLVVIVSFIFLFRSERRIVREMIRQGEFIGLFVEAPLNVCEARDTKEAVSQGLYGTDPQFAGISSVEETPENPET